MQVEVNKQDSILLPSLGHVIFGTDAACDFVLNSETSSSRQICSVIHDKAACILEVFNQEEVYINDLPVKEMAILHPGDTIRIEQQQLKIIDENNLPKACSVPFELKTQDDSDTLLITSVTGIRSFNKGSHGELAIVGSQNGFTHKPLSATDISFSVTYIDGNLTLLCQKDKTIEINGNKASYVVLKNGDYISTGAAKYCVESPGTSSFSKYSPSHPRNIQLSEEYLVNNSLDEKPSSGFLKNNLWWITLLTGLVIITILLVVLKNF
ncbi:hypothetical protein MNBD_GAMMA01-314 [hydrothermal vent metagenome]|uniref:FHA domain-containing protein n=1 Tax=hydrothermal vent metagenome TaxID=652676 RepID=A0A3B0W523_9ZZZZ